VAVELSAENHKAVYVPEGCAHGFQTLCDDTEIFYQMAALYAPGSARGVRWDDPAFAIDWPIADRFLSPRDRAFPDFLR
jgi:dTDP-4-dehydrorhamnose 3,5-epimerase